MSDAAAPAAPRVHIVTLGCGRNEVDTDQLAGLLGREGAEVVTDPDAADVVLVNTCTFIGPAKQESIDTILEACDLKTDGGSVRGVVVVGCMAERYPDELAAELPEADAVVGFDGYGRLPALVEDIVAGRAHDRVIARRERPVHPLLPGGGGATRRPALPLLMTASAPAEVPEAAAPGRTTTSQDDLDRIPPSGPRFPVRALTGARPWAYLKLASGCDRVCTFCAIPSFRGRFRSRPLDELVAEAAWLADQGVRELVLVSENTTSWGKDLPGGRGLQPTLLRELAAVDGIGRIRLMYLQPAELQPSLVEAMAAIPEVAGYFDLSLQHVSAPVLERMARTGSPERFLELVRTIRAADPGAVFRSNFILGFPGESEHDVAALEGFLEAARLDWVGLFPFSPEDGTPAAGLDGQVPAEVAAERTSRVSTLQEHLADAAARRLLGRRLDVLVEEVDVDPDGTVAACLGRSYREAPETDGEVSLVDPTGAPVDLPVGRFVTATVVESVGVDLVAEVDMAGA